MKAFDKFTYEDAVKLFTADRRTQTAKRAREFFKGNHWQEEWGYAGELPPKGYTERHFVIENILKIFTFENVIFEVTDTHTAGALGTEPWWDFSRNGKALNFRKKDEELKEGEQKEKFNLGEDLTTHWDERKSLQILTEAAEGLALEGAAVLRLYFPKGLLGERGTLPANLDFAKALTYLYSEVCTTDVAGVFTNPDTKKQIGIYLFEEGEENAKVKKADICYLDEDNKTVLRRLADGKETVEDEFGPYDLGGHLLLHELTRPALITDAVQSLQKSLNLTHTNKTRNISLAGNRQTDIVNGRVPDGKARALMSPPPQLTDDRGGNSGRAKERVYKQNPGWVNEIWGLPIYNETGSKIIGYTQPTINVREPVPVSTFREARDIDYSAILSQCFMLHKLISGDATASGKSREQARKEYERSLNKTAVVINAAGRWQLEVELRMAGQLSNTNVSDLRAVFQCNVEKVPVSSEERQENRADVDAGLMAPETAMRRNQIEDTGAELLKVEEFQAKKQKRQTQTMQPPVEDKTGDALAA